MQACQPEQPPGGGVHGMCGVGAAHAAIRTTDLSHAYVEENSAYSS